MMKNWKSDLLKLLPPSLNPKLRVEKIMTSIFKKNSKGFSTIKAGIFKNMLYINKANGSELTPKLLGTYEQELYPFLEDIIEKKLKELIVAGTAEGYFAIGLNYLFPFRRNIFFEMDTTARENLKKLAQINEVKNFETHPMCNSLVINKLITSPSETLLFMDIEGAEKECLDLEKVPALRECTIIVEVHDFIIPNIGIELIRRFQNTHNIQKVLAKERTVKNINIPITLLDRLIIKNRYLLALMSEKRPSHMYWLVMNPI